MRRLFPWLIAATGIAGTLLALAAGRGPQPAGLRYRHPLRGGESIDATIAFLEERVARLPKEGLDLAELAALQLEKARRTGDGSWLAKAEASALRSRANLPYSNHGATLALAKIAAARHDFPTAIRLADDVLAEAPRVVDALQVKAGAHLALGNLDEALAGANAAVDVAPLMGALSLRAQVLEAAGRDDEALEDWRAALRIEEPGQTGPSSQVRAFLGRWHLRHGRLDEARAWLEEARRINPAQPIAALALAEVASREGAAEEAERICNAAFNATRDPAFLAKLGAVRERAGNRAGAAAALAQAEALLRAELAEGRTGHRAEFARVLLQQGGDARVKEALALTAAELETRRPAEILGVHAEALLASGDAANAREAMREALATGVRSAELFARAAAVEARAGDPARARFYRDLAQRVGG